MPNQKKIAGKVLDCGEASIYVLRCLLRCLLRGYLENSLIPGGFRSRIIC